MMSRKRRPESNVIDNLYNKTRRSYIYMLPKASQTAGPVGLKFFFQHFFQIFFFNGQRRALQLFVNISLLS